VLNDGGSVTVNRQQSNLGDAGELGVNVGSGTNATINITPTGTGTNTGMVEFNFSTASVGSAGHNYFNIDAAASASLRQNNLLYIDGKQLMGGMTQVALNVGDVSILYCDVRQRAFDTQRAAEYGLPLTMTAADLAAKESDTNFKYSDPATGRYSPAYLWLTGNVMTSFSLQGTTVYGLRPDTRHPAPRDFTPYLPPIQIP
jgi:hypothetical protein